jgi:hypothetical protein
MLRELHVFHHTDTNPKISVKAKRNTRGWTVEADVSNCNSSEEALALLEKVTTSLCRIYGVNKPMAKEDV